MPGKICSMLKNNPYGKQFGILLCIDTLKSYVGIIAESAGIKLIGDGIIEKNAIYLFWGILLSVFGSLGLFFLLYYMTVYFDELKGKIAAHLRNEYMQNIMDDDKYEMKDRDKTYYILTNDTAQMVGFYNSFYDAVGSVNRFVASLIVGLYISWELSIIVLSLGMIKILMNHKIVSKMEGVIGESIELKQKMLGQILDLFEANILFRFFSKNVVRGRFKSLYGKYKATYKSETRYSVSLGMLNYVMDFVAIVVILAGGSIMAFEGYITLGSLVAFLTIQDTLTNPITFIGNFIKEFKYQNISYERYMEYSQCTKKEEPIMQGEDIAEVRICNMSYRYPNGKKIFTDLNANISAGEITYILGESGVGKTTLLKLLVNILQPDKGTIRFIDKKSDAVLHPRISYVSQKPLFFEGTVSENIALSREIDVKRLNSVIEKVQLNSLFLDSEEIQHLLINAKATNLSSGQRERLALARAFYHDSSILIFDEVFSAIDNSAMPVILNRLEGIVEQGKMVIIVTHKKEWIPDKAKIIYLEKDITGMNLGEAEKTGIVQ